VNEYCANNSLIYKHSFNIYLIEANLEAHRFYNFIVASDHFYSDFRFI